MGVNVIYSDSVQEQSKLNVFMTVSTVIDKLNLACSISIMNGNDKAGVCSSSNSSFRNFRIVPKFLRSIFRIEIHEK